MTLTTGLFNKRGGFTLLELILVLVLISTVLAMVAPSLRAFAGSRPVAEAAARLVALTDYARSRAVSEAREYRLSFDLSMSSFRLTAQDGGSFQPLGKEFGRTFALPEGTKADLTISHATQVPATVAGSSLFGQNAQGAASVTAGPFIAFYPDGRTEAAGIRLTDSRGNTLNIVCRSPTEHFIVETGGGGAQ